MVASELSGIRLTKLTALLAYRLRGHEHTTIQKQFFDITEAQAEPKIQPHGVTDDLGRKAVILIFGGGRRCVHARITPYQTAASQASQEVDNACETPERKEALRNRLHELGPTEQESSIFWLADHTQLDLDHPQQLLFGEVWLTPAGEQGSIFARVPSRVELEDELSVSLKKK
jgi:hypothetical protein